MKIIKRITFKSSAGSKTVLNPNGNLCWKMRASSLALRFEDQEWAPILKSSRVLSMPVTLPKTNLEPKIGGFKDDFPFKGVIFRFHVRFPGSTVYHKRLAPSSDISCVFNGFPPGRSYVHMIHSKLADLPISKGG